MGIDSTEGNGEGCPGDEDPPEPSRGEVRLERGRGTRGQREWVWGRRNLPLPRYNPLVSSLSGSTAQVGKQQFPTTVVRSGTTGLPNSKIFLPNSNRYSLVAFSNQLKPRFSQKSRDATTIAPKKQDLKTRQKERRNGGNTGIHGTKRGWGKIPPDGNKGAGLNPVARQPTSSAWGVA